MAWTPFVKEKFGLAIGGILVTCRFEIENMRRPYEWHISRPRGTTGSADRFLGRKPAEFDVRVWLTTAEEYAVWASIIAGPFKAPDKGNAFVISIDHPMLSEIYGITNVRIMEEYAPQPERDYLKRFIAGARFEEAQEPKTSTVTVKGSPPKNAAANPAAERPRAAELEKKKEENKQLTPDEQQEEQAIVGNDADSLANGTGVI